MTNRDDLYLEDEKMALVIVDFGKSFGKVFLAVKEITGKSTQEVRTLLKAEPPIVLWGSGLELNYPAILLQKAGARTRLVVPE